MQTLFLPELTGAALTAKNSRARRLKKTVLGISGRIYFVAALVLGLLFLLSAVRAALSKSNQHARQLLLASVLYLPLLFAVMVINR